MSILVQELFDYTTGTLVGGSGGTGWSSNWTGATGTNVNPQVSTGDMLYTGLNNGTETYTNRGKFYGKGDNVRGGSASRDFTSLPNSAGVVYWMAFTTSTYNMKYEVMWGLSGMSTDSVGTIQAVFLDYSANTTATVVSADGQNLFTGTSGYVTHLIVVKITCSGSSSVKIRVDWYLDPNLAQDASLWTIAKTELNWYMKTALDGLSYPSVGIASSGSDSIIYMDNFRIATTWQESVGQSGVTKRKFFFSHGR